MKKTDPSLLTMLAVFGFALLIIPMAFAFDDTNRMILWVSGFLVIFMPILINRNKKK
ncbi:hypothetical protein Q5O14_15655 [Eubacteriaceae bacterium ES2]|nr:hypothetical protein Q5O14_15655 [Eubacteriaceae bacterium ES2]